MDKSHSFKDVLLAGAVIDGFGFVCRLSCFDGLDKMERIAEMAACIFLQCSLQPLFTSTNGHDGRDADAPVSTTSVVRTWYISSGVAMCTFSECNFDYRLPAGKRTYPFHGCRGLRPGFWEEEILVDEDARALLASMVLFVVIYGNTIYFSRCLGIASRRPLL